MSRRFVVQFYVDVPDGHTWRGGPVSEDGITEWANYVATECSKGGPLKLELDSVAEYVERKAAARTIRGRKIVE